MEALKKIIEAQRAGHEDDILWMLGEQLLDIAEREPENRELLTQDLQIKEMSLAAAEANQRKYADSIRKGKNMVCISPKKAEELLRKFYGLHAPSGNTGKPAAEPPAKKTAPSFSMDDLLGIL